MGRLRLAIWAWPVRRVKTFVQLCDTYGYRTNGPASIYSACFERYEAGHTLTLAGWYALHPYESSTTTKSEELRTHAAKLYVYCGDHPARTRWRTLLYRRPEVTPAFMPTSSLGLGYAVIGESDSKAPVAARVEQVSPHQFRLRGAMRLCELSEGVNGAYR